jgi:ubiquinone/menaquinone biosynthesis C-methylase UbiE
VPVDLDEYRERSLDSWDRFASNWKDDRDFLDTATGRVAQRMVERLDPQAGDTVLELAAGIGPVGFIAAERIGEGGKLISTDFAPSMVQAARAVGDERGLDNVEYRVLDAERMDLDDSSFDGVLCRFGYMLMADPAAALAETRRVLRDGGRLSFAVWGSPERNPWAAIPRMTMVELGHLPPPEPGAPGILAMADPARINELVTAAGFGEPQIEEIDVPWGYADPDDFWVRTLRFAAPIADAFNALSESEQEKVRTLVTERAAERFSTTGGMDGLVLAVLAE